MYLNLFKKIFGSTKGEKSELEEFSFGSLVGEKIKVCEKRLLKEGFGQLIHEGKIEGIPDFFPNFSKIEEKGIEVQSEDDGKVVQISLNPGKGFVSQIENGIDGNFSKEKIILELGEPTKIGGGKENSEGKYIDEWILFKISNFSLNISFNKDGSIKQFTYGNIL